MTNSNDYDGLRAAIRQGDVRTFNDIFTRIDKGEFFKQCKMSPKQSVESGRIDTEVFTFGQCRKMAEILGIGIDELGALIEVDLP